MTTIQTYLAELPEEKKERIDSVFDNTDKFYAIVYLVIRNEHITDTEKPDRYEDRMQVIRTVKTKIEELLNAWQLDGKEIIADIASDYFEDYVQYKNLDFGITNEEFVSMVQKIMQQPV